MTTNLLLLHTIPSSVFYARSRMSQMYSRCARLMISESGYLLNRFKSYKRWLLCLVKMAFPWQVAYESTSHMLWPRLLLRTYSIVFIGRTKYSRSLEIGSYALREPILSLEGAVLWWDQETRRFGSFGRVHCIN